MNALEQLLTYPIPPERIATTPAHPRDSARLLFLRREDGHLEDLSIRDLPSLLSPKNLLVLNNSKVIPARLICSQNRTELLLLEQTSPGWWTALGTPSKRLQPGTVIFPDPVPGLTPQASPAQLRVEKHIPGGQLVLRVLGDSLDLNQYGLPPLPPYILKARKAHGQPDFQPSDLSDYQTSYAQNLGSVAAPTAGLHFTPELLAQFSHAFVTLHVGLGTFRPIKTPDYRDHPMHSEAYEIPPGLVQKANEADKIIAVGTTSARVLESAPSLNPHQGTTAAFIYPPYKFQRVGGLLTNFHLPHSTLLLLVAAFAGPEPTLRAYRHALEKGYRFFSFGDAMLIL